MRSPQNTIHAASGDQQKPATASCNARWVEAKALKPGDRILWCGTTIEPSQTVEAVRFGWWCRAYIQTGGNRTAFVVDDTACVRIAA